MYKKTLDGIEREYTGEPNIRYPLSAEDMVRIHSLLNMDLYSDKMFWLALINSIPGYIENFSCCEINTFFEMQ